jgi:PAS domain S-box-containing protein
LGNSIDASLRHKVFRAMKEENAIHILIIEDNPDDRASIRRMLLHSSDRSYAFSEAQLGAAGVRAYREAAGRPPDCVLLDYHLPDMNAPEVLAELRNGSEFPACPVVVLFGSDVSSGHSVLNAGAQQFLVKSWLTPESLTCAIQNAIERFKLIAEQSSAERKLRERGVRDFALPDVLSDRTARDVIDGPPPFDESGNVRGAVQSFMDSTDRQRAEAELRQAHAKLQSVLSSITDGLAVLDKNWRYTYFSEQGARIIGMRPEQLLGQCVWDMFPHTQGTKFYEEYHRAVESDQSVHFEEFYPEPLNSWIECHCYPSSEGLAVYFRDITDRKRAEEALREIAERYEHQSRVFDTTLSAITDFAYIFDREGRFLYANKALLDLWGLTLEAAVGKNFFDLKYPDDLAAKLQRQIQQVLRSGERLSDETPYTSPTGVTGYYEYIFSPVIAADGTAEAVAGSTRDISERKRTESALVEARQAAEAANQTKDRFLAVLSHELRSPLTPMLMAVAALEHDSDLRPAVREHLAMIKRNIHLETKLIDDLLDLSRITSGKVELDIEPVDLNETVRHVCGSCRSQMLEKGIRLETELFDAAALIAADSARIQQVLRNLLTNAIKFTPENGTIQVTTARVGGRWEMRVQDNGIGISMEALPRIFDAFEQGGIRVTRQFGGLGLGLAISKSLVELHRGSIRAESAGPGQGSTFIVELPGAEIDTVGKAPHFAPAESGKQPKMRLLLVEDHHDTARTISRLLRSAGFTVTTATDVASASAAADKEPFDVLVSDLGLPDGDGYEIMRRIRAIRSMPGIAMSGYGMNEDRRRSHEAGFSEHLVKPIDLPQLVAAIRRVTDNRS